LAELAKKEQEDAKGIQTEPLFASMLNQILSVSTQPHAPRLAEKMELAIKPFKMRSLLVIKSICKEGMRTLHMLAKVV
jgi:hypothetical protein